MRNSVYIHYDSNLSISLSVDPLTEQTMTPYQYTYQNPVRYIDPDGKAPYDHIFTWKNGKLTMYDNKNGSSHIYVNGVLMSDLDLTQSSNRKVVANIAAFYANKVGIKSKVYGGKGNIKLSTTLSSDSSENNPAFTYGNDIYLNIKDYVIACFMSDYNNLMSVMEHEGLHKERKQGFEATRGTSYDHAQVYADQILSNVFNKTTKEFQDGIIQSFTDYLNAVNKEEGLGVKQDNLMRLVNRKLRSMDSNKKIESELGSGIYKVIEK